MPTPNMNLVVPIVGVTPGPAYANNVNSDFSTIDSHDHSTGKGVPVTPAGLSISSDLSFQNNNATALRTARLSPQSGTLSGSLDLGCVYNVTGDLFYNDGSGTPIRITQFGAVAGTPGSISNLVPPASASYNGVTDSFVWQSNTNTPANMDFASAVLRNLTSGSHGLTLAPPTLSSDYTITLPALPGQEQFISINASGTMFSHWVVDNSSIYITSNQITVKPLGITRAMLATGVGTLTSQQFTSSTTFTVPSGVTNLIWTLVGAGGGGGGGGPTNGTGKTTGSGGGGGSAGQVLTQAAVTSPGEVWTITVGALGTAGTAGTSVPTQGGAGGNGGQSKVVAGTSGMQIIVDGGGGGSGGQNNGAAAGSAGSNGGNGGTTLQGLYFASGGTGSASAQGNAPTITISTQVGAGGGGGSAGYGVSSGSTGAAGSGASSGSVSGGGANGTQDGTAGGGGGAGGTNYYANSAGGAGGNGGGAGSTTSSPGSSASGFGAGGGGGGGGNQAHVGSAGGAGSPGVVYVFYVG